MATVLTFSDWLCTGPEVEYEDLAIDLGYLPGTHSRRRIVAACGKTLTRLRLQSSECVVSWIILRMLTDLTRVSGPMNLPHCPGLRELEFSALYPSQIHLATISTITSINIWKITFSSYSLPTALDTFLSHSWTSFDDCISPLADKLRNLGSKQTLEVQFRSEYLVIDSLPVDYKRFLPKFSEKGRVTIVHCPVKWMGPGAYRLFSLARVMLPSDSDSSTLLDGTGCMMDRSDARWRDSETWDFQSVLRAEIGRADIVTDCRSTRVMKVNVIFC